VRRRTEPRLSLGRRLAVANDLVDRALFGRVGPARGIERVTRRVSLVGRADVHDDEIRRAR